MITTHSEALLKKMQSVKEFGKEMGLKSATASHWHSRVLCLVCQGALKQLVISANWQPTCS